MKASKTGLPGLLAAAFSCAAAANCVDATASWQVANVRNASEWTEFNG